MYKLRLLFENIDKFQSRIRNLLPPMNKKSNHNYVPYQLETEILLYNFSICSMISPIISNPHNT